MIQLNLMIKLVLTLLPQMLLLGLLLTLILQVLKLALLVISLTRPLMLMIKLVLLLRALEDLVLILIGQVQDWIKELWQRNQGKIGERSLSYCLRSWKRSQIN